MLIDVSEARLDVVYSGSDAREERFKLKPIRPTTQCSGTAILFYSSVCKGI